MSGKVREFATSMIQFSVWRVHCHRRVRF